MGPCFVPCLTAKAKNGVLEQSNGSGSMNARGDKGLLQDLRRDSAQGQLTQLPGFHLKEAMRTIRGPAP